MNRLASIAARQDAERERIGRYGLAQVNPLVIRFRAAALKAYKFGGDPAHHIAGLAVELEPLLRDAMVTAHLYGRRRALIQAEPNLPVSLDIQDTAVDFLRRRMSMSDAHLKALRDLYGKPAAQITSDLTSDLERKVAEAVQSAVADGLHGQQGIARIREAFDAAGVAPRSNFGLETIFRTQVQVAYSAGQWNAHQDPAVQDILWGYEYATAGDDRVRPNHAALDGVRLPKDDPRWDQWTPPCGWNCRCGLTAIFVGDAEAQTREPSETTVTVGNRQVPVGPDPGWGFHPGKLYRDTLALA